MMHNLSKIKWFRIFLWIVYPFAWLLIYPFALLKKKNTSQLFFFFDRYAIGGAQRVHLDILDTVRDIPKQVYFTRRSLNDKLKQTFYTVPNSKNADIHFWCDNLLFRFLTVHFFAFYINRHPRAIVLSSNSTFFYDMVPFLKEKVYTIELLHNFTFGKMGMEFFGLANYKYLDKRLVIDANTLNNIHEQYKKFNVPPDYFKRIQLIEFGVDIPEQFEKSYTFPLKILYAGRGGPQKRVWLVDKVAAYFIDKKEPVEFHFAGPIEDELSPIVISNSKVHGPIDSKERMNDLFRQSHVLLLTSAYEGFPLVVKEAMAYGCVPLVTALPGNKTHLKDSVNSLLIDAIEDEERVVNEAIEKIESLIAQPDLLKKLSGSAYEYATKNFKREKFIVEYRRMLTEN